MHNVRLFLTFIFLLIFLLPRSSMAESKYPPVKIDTAMAYIENLSDPWRYNGRKSGSVGGNWAMTIISERFDAWGLKPLIGDSILVPFDMLACVELKGKLTLTDSPWGRINYLLGDDFTICTNSGSGKIQAPVTLVGHGFSKPDKDWDDYKGVDVHGRIVVIIRGTPDNGEDWEEEFHRTYTYPEAVRHGAVAILFYDRKCPIGGAAIVEEAYNPDVPAGYISERVLTHLLRGSGYSVKSYVERLKKGPFPLELDATLRLQVKVERLPDAKGWNVVGVVKGKDKNLSKEAVIIGAHGDHVGMNAEGQVYAGADDNASGTGVVMELARTFAKYPQRRTMIFCIFAGEEQGLLGSKALAPQLPEDYTYIGMINLDMVGRGDGVFGIGGGDMLPEIWGPWWDNLTRDEQDNFAVYRAWEGNASDHAPFRDVNIPALNGWSKGSHDFFHSTEDLYYTIEQSAVSGALKGTANWVTAAASYPKPLAKARIAERTIWHCGFPLSWHQGTGEPALDLKLAARRLRDGYMGMVISLPRPALNVARAIDTDSDSTAEPVDLSPLLLQQQLAVLDRWKDAFPNYPQTLVARNLKELPENSSQRKASIFLALEADSLEQPDTTMIQASHALGVSWTILRSYELWTFEGAVRVEKAPVLRELAKDEAVIQVPLNDAKEWVPVAEKEKGRVVVVGSFKDFISTEVTTLEKLRNAGAGIIVILDSEDIREAVKVAGRIETYKVHVQPLEQEYLTTLDWVSALMVAGVEKETILQWLGGNMKLW